MNRTQTSSGKLTFKLKYFIDSHKAVTGPFILLLIALFDQWENPTAWAYFALHGTYGVLWNLKSRIFPDKNWEQPRSLWYGVGVAWGGLTFYWLAPVIIMVEGVQAPAWVLGVCASVYVFGIFLHFASDMQKHTALQLRPGRLITEGLWSRCRNPNYFGELLIYLGFGLLAMHWIPLAVIAAFVVFYWLPQMRKKDRSLSRYPEFAAYKQRTSLFIPFVW